jgi:phosphoglycolate phosphatase-like HAD superfamily hydrolase
VIKNIFFDFDGVLAESVSIKTEAFRQLYICHGEKVAAKIVKHHIENGGISRFEKFKIYQDWLGLESGPYKIKELSLQFSELVKQGVIDAPEVRGTLSFLKKFSKHYQRWIISGTPTAEINEIVAKRGLSEYFSAVYGSPEKKEEWINYIINKWNLKKKETVYVGDAVSDHTAAIDSEIVFILRETKENPTHFKNYKGPRIIDMTQLHNILSII